MLRFVAVLCVAVGLLAGCGGEDDLPYSQEEAERIVSEANAGGATTEVTPVEDAMLTQDDWPDVLSSPDDFKGRTADGLVGRVFVVERDGSRVVLQMNTSRDLSDGNTIVAIDGNPAARRIQEQDYVRFSGEVQGGFTGTNAFGGEVTAPIVYATDLRKIDAAPAILAADPPVATKQLNVSGEQAGLTVTVKRVDRLADGGRVIVEARNRTGSAASLYSSSVVLVQGDRQADAELSFDLPDWPSELQSDVTSEAVILFPGMRRGPATLVVEWYSDNFDITAEPFRLSFRVP